MRLQNLREERQPKLMIIPMIDIIFFLLVFFMMSTLYMVEQKTIPVNLPQASSTQANREQSLPITVLVNGKILFEKEEIPHGLLHRRVEAAMQRDPNTVFVLRSDERTEYKYVVEVLDALKNAGVKRLAIATERKAE